MPNKDPEKNREQQRRWRAANSEKHRDDVRRWREVNPEKNREKVRANCRAYRVRKLGADGSHTFGEWKWLREIFGNKCVRCGAEGVTKDHIVPLSKGGSDFIINIQTLCMSCNHKKNSHHSTDYRNW